jgi:hypothetical protein
VTRRGAKRQAGAVVAAVLLAPWRGSANPPDYLTNDRPIANSAAELASPFSAPPAQAAGFRPGAFASQPFFRDAEFRLEPRLYFRYNGDGQAIHEAFAAGGALDFTSGWWRDAIQIGATAYTTQPLATPSGRGSTGLLRDNGDGFSVLGLAWVKLRTGPVTTTLYRQDLDLPFINGNDSRMVPNTFEAYRLEVKPSDVFRFGLAYVDRIKDRTSADFESMAEAAGAPRGTDRGTALAGFVVGAQDKAYLGAMDQWTFDLFNTIYVQAGKTWRLTEDLQFRGDVQFVDQQSVGEQLIGPLDVQLYGARLTSSYRSAVLTLAYTNTPRGTVFSPFGGDPAFNSVMISDYDQAGEKSYGAGLSYHFARLGLAGVTASTSFVHGEIPTGYHEDEVNATVDYRITTGVLKNLWLRLRYAHNAPNDSASIDEFRVTLNYALTF